MDNSQYNQKRYNKKRQWYRLRLGLQQTINHPIINLIWVIIAVGMYFLFQLREIILLSFDTPQVFEQVFCWCLNFFVIAFPLILVIGILQGIGKMTAKRDEADVFIAFGDKRDVKTEAPLLISKKRIKGKEVTVREFYTTIPMERWKEKKEAISDIMNIRIIGDIEYSNHHGNKIIIKSAKGRQSTERGVLYDDTF